MEMIDLSIILPSQENFLGNRAHLKIFSELLKTEGVDGWNSWRRKNKNKRLNLKGVNLSYLSLIGIDLTSADLNNSSFIKTNLWNADLRDSNFSGSAFVSANLLLLRADRSIFDKVNLAYATLTGSRFFGSTITNSKVTAVTVWGIETNEYTIQKNLYLDVLFDPLMEEIEARELPKNRSIEDVIIRTDNIETAYILYLFSRREQDLKDFKKNDKLRIILESLTDKIVLILGNFSLRQKAILKDIRISLSGMGYAPVIFDFARPKNRDLIETVSVLAGLSRFVIADLTKPRSIPLESVLITPGLMVPFAAIIQKDSNPFKMFEDLRTKYFWVLEPWKYKDKEDILKKLKTEIVNPSEKMWRKIKNHRAKYELKKPMK